MREPIDRDPVPAGLRVAAGWTWRLLVIAFGVYWLLRVLGMFQVLVVPVLVALLVSALLNPVATLLTRRQGGPGLPRQLAALLAIVLALLVIVGLFSLVGQQLASGFSELRHEAFQGWHELQRQLAASRWHISSDQIGRLVDRAGQQLRSNGGRVVTGAVAVSATAVDVFTGFFVVVLSTYFFLSDGDRIWAWVVGLFPRSARARAHGAGVCAWATLTSYVRATVVVALVDGLGVGVIAAILGIPLAFPLGVLVFLGAFVPIVGAFVSGIVAVLIALVAKGPVIAMLMLGGLFLVNQVEAHGLQPFLMGHAVRVHPLAVILSIGVAVVIAGVVGGLFAVPLAAVINVVTRYLRDESPPPGDSDGAGPTPQTATAEVIDATGPLADVPARTGGGATGEQGRSPAPTRQAVAWARLGHHVSRVRDRVARLRSSGPDRG